MVSASSDISEEMIKSSFLECFQIMMFLHYFFLSTSSVFYFLFFFPKCSPKIGVHYTQGVHYTRVNTVMKLNLHFSNLFSFVLGSIIIICIIFTLSGV